MDSMIITLPIERREQLEKKQAEYRSRIQPHQGPEQNLDTGMKIEVVQSPLDRGAIAVSCLLEELRVKLGELFSPGPFENACAVIEDYCETGVVNLIGGTGLPE